MKRVIIAIVSFLFVLPATHAADDIDQIFTLSQAQFKLLVEDVGTAVSYRAMSPAEPLGITGFDIGLEVTSTDMPNFAAWSGAVSSGETLDELILPKLHLIKGLPWRINVGAFYVGSSNSNVELTGFEVSYAILKGSTIMPAISLRGAISTLSGVDEVDIDTETIELSISKGFAMLTPYAGIGEVKIKGDPTGTAALVLNNEDISSTKTFIGLNINLGLLNIVVDTDKTGDATSVGAKLGWRW